jgi:alcohol dehydrogenase class IV
VAAYNADAASDAMQRIARALNAHEAWIGLHTLALSLGAPTSLAELGMPESGIERAVELACRDTYANPRRPDAPFIRQMLERAWKGLPPARVH